MSFHTMVFVGSLMNVFVLDRQVRVFFDRRRTSFPIFALSFLFYVVLTNALAHVAIPRISMLVWIVARMVVGLNYEGTWKKRIVAALLFTPIGMAMEMGVLLMFGVYFDHFLARPLANDFLTMTITTLIYFMATLAMQKFINLKKDVVSSPTVLAVVFALPLSSIVLTFIFLTTADPSPLATVFAGGIIFGTNVMVFWLLERLSSASQATLHARESVYYLEQCRMMGEALNQTKAVRHDMKAHLSAISGLAAEGKPGEIVDYVGGLLGGPNADRAYSDTGNTVFDSVVNYKLRNAVRDGVRPVLRLSVPPDLNVAPSDLAAILGNLLDNALEAVAKVDDRTIRMDAKYLNGVLSIKTTNAFDGLVRYQGSRLGGARFRDTYGETDANEKRLPVTRKPGGDHGYGLRSIQRAVEKYDGLMKIKYGKNVFSVAVMLYVAEATG